MAVVLTGPAYRYGFIDVIGIQTAFGLAASAALAAIIGGLALSLLLPARDQRDTLFATFLSWLYRLAVLGVFGVTLAFLASRVVPGLGARTDPERLLSIAGVGVMVAVLIGFIWAAAQPAGMARPGLLSTLLGVTMGVTAAYVPISWRIAADTLPRINDVSTDTTHPPDFTALRVQPGGGNGGSYPGEATAAAQHAGYPDIRPLHLKEAPAEVFARIERVARELGWQIAASEPAQGRLEAVATSIWFGFQDDVVVRLTTVGDGCRVDIRSKSRAGISDLGANAARIRLFFARLQKDRDKDRHKAG
ncbi:MAG: DUF1499 domain-containing protein [Alphaproteobacteria bacterium]|nr:DUF1499 domain-containing protein [Alphaproteobacteria bacterium]